MAKTVAIVAVMVIATVAGTTFTVFVWSAWWGSPESIIEACTLAATAHVLSCGAYVIMGESVIEDAVKTGFLTACGAVMLYSLPLPGLMLISAAALGFATNQGLNCVLRWQKYTAQVSAPDSKGV